MFVSLNKQLISYQMVLAFCQGIAREMVKRHVFISDVGGSVTLLLTVVLYKEYVGKKYISKFI